MSALDSIIIGGIGLDAGHPSNGVVHLISNGIECAFSQCGALSSERLEEYRKLLGDPAKVVARLNDVADSVHLACICEGWSVCEDCAANRVLLRTLAQAFPALLAHCDSLSGRLAELERRLAEIAR